MRTTLWVTAAFLFLSGCHKQADPLPGFPRLVLWAWERRENLEFLDPHAVGVAFLARTVSWQDGQLKSQPRLQSLRLPSGTRTIAVVRLESGGPRFPCPRGFVSAPTSTACRKPSDCCRIPCRILLSRARGRHALIVKLPRDDLERATLCERLENALYDRGFTGIDREALPSVIGTMCRERHPRHL